MDDRIPTPGLEGRVKIIKEDGTSFLAFLEMADSPLNPGTPISKATLLKDATAAMFGFGSDAVPDDVLAYLGQYNQHWWWRKATTSITAWREVQTLESKQHIASPDGTDKTITYSTKIQIDQSTGAVTLVNPQTFTVNHRGHQPPFPCYFTGVYDDPTSVFYFGKTDGTSLFISSGEVGYSVWINPNSCYKITSESYQIPTGEVDYVRSSDRNAYPDSGVSDGYEWQYLGVPFDNAVTAPKVVFGSYVGTGKYGYNNPNSLTFPFVPKILVVSPIDGNRTPYIFLEGCTHVYANHSGGGSMYAVVTYGQTIKWYNTENADYQFNDQNKTFFYIAIS